MWSEEATVLFSLSFHRCLGDIPLELTLGLLDCVQPVVFPPHPSHFFVCYFNPLSLLCLFLPQLLTKLVISAICDLGGAFVTVSNPFYTVTKGGRGRALKGA